MIWREKVNSAIYESSQPFFDGFRFLELGMNNITVLSPIDGHSKKQTPLIGRWFYFPQGNSGQTAIKKLSKKWTSN